MVPALFPFRLSVAPASTPVRRPVALPRELRFEGEPGRLFIYMDGYRQNQSWEQAMEQLAVRAVAGLRQGHYETLDSLLAFLETEYAKAIEDLPLEVLERTPSDKEKAQFGKRRKTDKWHTRIDGRYVPYLARACALAGTALDAPPGRMHRMTTPDGQIALTETVRDKKGWLWRHPSLANVEKALLRCEGHFQAIRALAGARRSPEHLQQSVREVASLHWLMTQAMPYMRGGAGITDLLSKTLLDYLGIETFRWRPGLAPDLEALVTPMPVYVANYAGFFRQPPRYEAGSSLQFGQDGRRLDKVG